PDSIESRRPARACPGGARSRRPALPCNGHYGIPPKNASRTSSRHKSDRRILCAQYGAWACPAGDRAGRGGHLPPDCQGRISAPPPPCTPSPPPAEKGMCACHGPWLVPRTQKLGTPHRTPDETTETFSGT